MALLLRDRTAALQTWLNLHGAKLVVDGIGGAATRQAIFDVFRNTQASPITPAEISLFAAEIGVTARQLATIAKVESGGSGWDNRGLLTALWERHYLWRRVQITVPVLSNPARGGYTIDADGDGINDSWEKLADAALKFGFGIAAECASFGKFQIMGAWWKQLGYPSVADFIWQMTRSEAAHYRALVRYIEVNRLEHAAQAISDDPRDCLAFARGFNGKGQQGYDYRLADTFRKLK